MRVLFALRKTRSHHQLCFRHMFILGSTVFNILSQNMPQVWADKNPSENSTRSPIDFLPFMQPFVRLFENYSADSPKKVFAKNDTQSINSSRPIPPDMFDAEALIRRILGVTTTTTTTTVAPRPSDLLVQTIFEPIIDSIEKEIRKANAAKNDALVKAGMTRDGVKTLTKKIPNALLSADYDYGFTHSRALKPDIGYSDFPRRAPSAHSLRNSALMKKMLPVDDDKYVVESLKAGANNAYANTILKSTPLEHTDLQPNTESEPSPLASLLRFMGVDARPRNDEVRVGRDRSVSVLGMPVGRRDGLALSPLTGVSLGNQDMFGPVAINDRYNVKWDFLDQFRSAFEPPQRRRYYRA